MFKNCISFLKYSIIWLLLLPYGVQCDYEQQPKIHVKNGGLLIEAAYDRNISMRLSRDSSLYLNNVDVMEKIRQRYTPTSLDGDKTKQLDVPTPDKLKDDIQELHDDLERFANRLIGSQNRTRRTLQLGVIRRNMWRLNRLSGRLIALERLLKKDECAEATEPCKNGGTCYDSYNDFHCECTEGYTGKTCEDDVDECYMLAGTDLGCQNNAICTNTPGSYKCTCAKGYTGTHCRLRNAICHQEQSQELCAHGTCVPANNQQGYTCVCEQGWKQNTTTTNSTTLASLACDIDVNECDSSTNPCHHECINLPGSFKCGPCPAGYTGNGMTCLDIDECSVNNGGCSLLPKVRCINTEGSYRCGNCPPGWLGDGHLCELAPSNSCDAEKICHAQAKCEYISNIATCTCPPGMFGHGFGPQGCHTNPITDSCENHLCQNNGTCITSGRSTSCLCPLGYSGALCETADGCHPNPCENDGVCKPLVEQTFKCTCLPGTTGKRCEILRSICAKTTRRPTGELKYPTDDSPEYSINERCAWIIRTTPGQILNVTFTKFDIEDNPECSHDWLQIHDGSSLASQLIGRFCGNNLPLGGTILSSHNILFFWFRSDNATNRPGFEMKWVSQPHICGETIELGMQSSGVIKSPGYPGKTPTNRECQWKLSAPYGYRFVIRIYEIVLGTRPNCTGDTLKVYDADLLLKQYCLSSQPEPLRSSSNKLSLHFHTDGFSSDSSFQLHYEVESGIPHCGGLLTEISGVIVGPTRPATCLYLIQQPPGTQIKWEFLDIKPFEVENCNLNSIEIFDGKTDEAAKLLTTCSGKKLEAVVSSTNYMLIRYKSSITDDRHDIPFRAKYSRACELKVFGPDPGIIITPNYPMPYTEHITCTFHIYGPASTVVLANFSDFSISETKIVETNEIMDNSNNKTTVSNLNDDYITYVDVYLSKTNKRRYFKASPIELRSERNEMIIVFHATTNTEKARGLHILYSFETLTCGGVYTENTGSFVKYLTVNQQCMWIFEAPEGKHIKLDLDFLPFVEDTDFLIVANTTGGRDLMLYNITHNERTKFIQTFNFNVLSLIIKNTVYRLIVSYEFTDEPEACGGNFSTLSGAISSPSWPASYKPNLECVWVITAPVGKKIELTVQNFTLEPTCSGDILEIRNGKFSYSPLIGRYCGNQIPSRIPSFTNNLYLRFKTDDYIEGSGFHLTWDQTTTGCGGKLTSYKGSIHSPHFDNSNENENRMQLTCDWEIIVAQGSLIDLTITPTIDLFEFCRNNNLKIYDGSSTLSPMLLPNCTQVLRGHQFKLKSSTNQLTIIYTLTENSKYNSPEFVLYYETNCNNILSNYRGIIESSNFPEYYPENQNCAWDIKAGRNNKLQLAFSHLSMEAENMECEFDYVEVWDMNDEDVLKKTHLCTQLPDPITTEGNHLRIRFVTDYSNSRNGFRAEYTRIGCGEHLEKDFGSLTSPNYPYSNDVDCDWYIEVSAGRQIVLTVIEFHLESDNPDCSRDMLLIRETKNSSLDLIKECQMQQIPLTITSPSNRLYLHFHTSSVRARKFFKGFYHTKQATCGGMLRGTYGLITSPKYPYTANADDHNCVWDITVPESYGIVLDFKDFQLSDSKNCTDASLQFSKLTGMSEIYLDKFCGSEKPSLKLVHGNRLRVQYKDTGVQGMGKFYFEFRKQCGGLISQPSGYIKSLTNEDCIWEFDVPEGTLISINILKLDCYCQKNNEGGKICVNGLGFKENQFDEDTINSSNYTMFLCEEHQSNLVFEVSKLHVFGKNINFEAKYSTTQHSCGGTLTSAGGSLASPYYPSTYPANMECEWMLQATKGTFIELQFDQMDIAKSEHCNEDYLEIREWSASKVLGIYCGNEIPEENIISFERFWLRFHSSEGSTGNGFKLRWNYAHLNEIVNKTKGSIEAPSVKMVQNDDEPYAWRILVERGQYVLLEFEEYNNGLNLYDGYDDTAVLVDISPSPWRFVSSSNVVYLKTDNVNFDLFRIRWSITTNKTLDANATVSECHSEQFIKVHRFNAIRIISPGYPQGYNNNMNCDWIFKPTNPTEHVVVALYNVDLETTGDCTADYLKISTSSDLENWQKLEKICNGSRLETLITHPNVPQRRTYERPFKYIHGTPHIKLDFVTDASINRTGFYAKVLAKCGSNMTDSVGFIDSKMFSDFFEGTDTQCLWHIHVKPGKRIRLQLDYPKPAQNRDNLGIDCKNYAVLYDGVDDHAPIMAPGKICSAQNVTRLVLNSTSNHLTIKYNINLDYNANHSSWNLTYREYSECSQEIRLIPEAPEVNITSPQYPNVPHPHTDCEWRIVAPQGELIQVEFLERFDMNSRFCTKEFLELFDGSTILARSLGRHCRKPANVIKTTQNILYMHYLTDITEPRNGFKARISISQCGSSFSENYGFIKSPGYPGSYPSSTQCDFAINLSQRAQIRIFITDLHLPYDAQKLSTSDYLEIITIDNDDLNTSPLLIYGNATKGSELQIASNKAIIRFHTFMKTTKYRGFMLRYSADSSFCSHDVTGVSGHINMIFVTKLHFMNSCTWKIRVPKKQRVRLEFLNMNDLKEHNSSSLLTFSIFNNFDWTSSVLTFTPNTFDPNMTIQSTDNFMLIKVNVPRGELRLKTLRAHYTSTESSPCPNDIGEETRSGLIDIRDTEPVFNGNYYCGVNIKISKEETLALNITAVFTSNSTTNSHYRITNPVVIKDAYYNIPIRNNLTQEIRGLSQETGSITILQNENLRIKRLQISYRKYACGGMIKVIDGVTIKQPQLVDELNNGPILCVWTLTKPYSSFGGDKNPDFKLLGNVTFSESCENESIRIFINQWEIQEPIKKICKDNQDDIKEIVLNNRKTFVVYYSKNYNSQKSQFAMNIKKTITCGSETTVNFISSMIQIDKSLYTNNQECSWIFSTQPGLYLQMQFLNRFFIENSPNCTKDYLEIQRYEQGLWLPEARFCGREVPTLYNISSSRIQIIFRTDDTITADGFSFAIQTHCRLTVNVTSTQPQIIVSPTSSAGNWRKMHCEYIFQGNDTSKLINVKTRFESSRMIFARDICRLGTLTVFKHDETGKEKEGIKHCEMEFEERAYKYLRYSYEAYIQQKFTIEYSYDSCGGNITSPTTIRPLKHEQNNQYADNMNCVWYITAPVDHSIAVRFKYFETEENYDHVSIYSGLQISAEKRLIKLSGNQSTNTPTIVVDQNQAVINAISDVSSSGKGFEANIVFIANCNERISLTDGNSPVTLARNFKFNSTEEYICNYRITAPNGYRIKVDIKKLQINGVNSTCHNLANECAENCNYLEVFDKTSSQLGAMGKFCSSNSANKSVLTSYEHGVLKLNANYPGQYNFEIILNMLKTECGEFVNYKLGDNEKYKFTFPRNEDVAYAANTHCTWRLTSDHTMEMHFNYIDLQNTSQVTGKCLDYILIKGPYSSQYLCGHVKNFTVNLAKTYNDYADITFHSDDSVEGKGFEFVAHRNDVCNRTYNALSGSIEYTGYGKEMEICNDTIVVSENYTLNIFVNSMYFKNYECDRLHLKITDLKTNKILLSRCQNAYNNVNLFTTTNAVRIEASEYTSIGINYVASNRSLTPGCGGSLYSNQGYFASPLYENDRNFSECRWDIIVPSPNNIQLSFYEFNMGTPTNCNLDNLKVIEILPNNSEKLLKTLCGSEQPDAITSSSNHVAVISKKSPNFDGIGWTVNYNVNYNYEKNSLIET